MYLPFPDKYKSDESGLYFTTRLVLFGAPEMSMMLRRILTVTVLLCIMEPC